MFKVGKYFEHLIEFLTQHIKIKGKVMEKIGGLEITNSSEVVDYIIKKVIYNSEPSEKFQELIENTNYKDDGIFNLALEINNISFDRIELKEVFNNIYLDMEKYFENKYKDIEYEVDTRFQEKVDAFFEKVNSLRYKD